MNTMPTARQWAQVRLWIKIVIGGPNVCIDRFIEDVARYGRLSPELLAAFPVLTQNRRSSASKQRCARRS